MFLADSSNAFLGTPPTWTLNDSTLLLGDGREVLVTQREFSWSDGFWRAEVALSQPHATASAPRLVIQVAPSTLRRWSEVGIDPLVEALMQLRDHVRRLPAPEGSRLTLL